MRPQRWLPGFLMNVAWNASATARGTPPWQLFGEQLVMFDRHSTAFLTSPEEKLYFSSRKQRAEIKKGANIYRPLELFPVSASVLAKWVERVCGTEFALGTAILLPLGALPRRRDVPGLVHPCIKPGRSWYCSWQMIHVPKVLSHLQIGLVELSSGVSRKLKCRSLHQQCGIPAVPRCPQEHEHYPKYWVERLSFRKHFCWMFDYFVSVRKAVILKQGSHKRLLSYMSGSQATGKKCRPQLCFCH